MFNGAKLTLNMMWIKTNKVKQPALLHNQRKFEHDIRNHELATTLDFEQCGMCDQQMLGQACT